MTTIKRFQEIKAWQKARELTRVVYDFSNRAPLNRDFALRDQMRRACISILSNIAEGFERSGSGEFRQFLSVAKGSAAELEAQLYVALDQKYISEAEFNELQQLSRETQSLLAGFMDYLKNSKIRGQKYNRKT
jgi:four helix bundle protein